MQTTYAVTWQEAEGGRRAGRLEFASNALQLEGRNGHLAARRIIRYDDVSGFRLARSSGERLHGRPTLVLELFDGGVLKIASVAQPGIVGELADHLGRLTGQPRRPERAALVVPLRPGSRSAAEALLAEGPPFDPAELGLEGHEVYVDDDEVVFVFEGSPSVFVERLAADETIWDAAEAWKPLIGGPIRYADAAYAWND